MDIISIEISQDEAWLMQTYIRHEMPEQGKWESPPCSKDLNDQIAEALVFFDSNPGELSKYIEIILKDCYTIDYCIPNSAKSQKGDPIGKTLLIKTYNARCILKGGLISKEDSPDYSYKEAINANPSNDTDNEPNSIS